MTYNVFGADVKPYYCTNFTGAIGEGLMHLYTPPPRPASDDDENDDNVKDDGDNSVVF